MEFDQAERLADVIVHACLEAFLPVSAKRVRKAAVDKLTVGFESRKDPEAIIAEMLNETGLEV